MTNLSGRIVRSMFVGCLLVVLSSSDMWAQTTAQISGAVKDPSGAVLPGVEVSATQTATGASRTVISDETGSYQLTNLPIGPYMLEATLPGFRTYVQSGIILQVGSNPLVNVVMEVGQVTETVEVQADAALVETRSTSVGQVIDNQRVLELPLNGRQITELIFLAGAANAGGVGAVNSIRNYPTVAISVAGGMGNGVLYQLDGANYNNVYMNTNLPMPFPDALQEFKVETSAVPAQYGQHSSGVMNAVTKSGTNEFHGDLFAFVRNGSLNARNAFALTNDGLKRYQWGGVIGGPIVRNNLFFFAGYQRTTENARPTTDRAYVPTAAMLAGDFTAFASPACNNGRQVILRAPFVDNRVNPTLFSPVAVGMVTGGAPNTSGYKLPAAEDECGLHRYSRTLSNGEHLNIGRVDYQWSDRRSLFFRYMQGLRFTPTDFSETDWLAYTQADLWQRSYSLAVGQTDLIGANTVSSFRSTINRAPDWRWPSTNGGLDKLGVRNVFIPYPGYHRMTVTNAFQWGVNTQVGIYNGTHFQFSEDLSTVRGAHQIGYGANYIRSNLNAKNTQSSNPTHTFSGQAATGIGLADFMLGKASDFRQGNENIGNTRQHYFGLYIQDTWKATPKLTVNAGLRWEPGLPAYEVHGHKLQFSQEWFDQGTRSTVFRNAPAGLQFPPFRGSDEDKGDGGTTNKYQQNSWLHFAPRLGLAVDPSGNGRLTIRAAYGILFDYPHLWMYTARGNNSPWGGNLVLLNPRLFEDPWADYPGGSPFPSYPNPDSRFQPYANYTSDLNEDNTTYVHQWNLSIQKAIGTDWLISSNYIGNSILHLLSLTELNPAAYMGLGPCTLPNGVSYPVCSTTGNINQRRMLNFRNFTQGQYFGNIAGVAHDATSNYHGLLLSVQRRRSNGLTVQGNYTWSHCIGDMSVQEPGITPSAEKAGRRQFTRGDCSGDVRHVFNLSTVYETPQFVNRALQILGSGWQVSAIVRVQAGSPLNFERTRSIQSGADTALTGDLDGLRANQVLADPYHPNRENGFTQWLNTAAFARPDSGQFGNASVNIVGPGAITINTGLTRKFQLRENQAVEFRAEAFNMPNHLNPNNPIFTMTDPNFGKIITAGDPRIMQLALKYVF